MDLGKYAALFRQESREHLDACNRLLLAWERAPTETEAIEGLFRAIHTLKGMAATMGFARLSDLSHRTETLLDALRRGDLAPGAATVDLLLRVVDALDRGVEDALAGREDGSAIDPLLAELDAASIVPAQAAGTADRPRPRPTPAGVAAEGSRTVAVRIRRGASMRGARALLALKRAEALGTVSAVRPPAAAWEDDAFEGSFTFVLTSPVDDVALSTELHAAGEVEEVRIGRAANLDEEARGPARGRQIRIDQARLDGLTHQVGELVLARNRLAELAARGRDAELDALSARITRLVSDLQSEVLQARMIPVWQVFDRFPRPVRDLARQVGKDVALEIQGDDIELDRAILDGIGEPVLHLLRNAVDHGLETPRERKAAGKPREGRLVLTAARERNAVTIRVEDDGRGIDRAAVLAKARREGLAGPEQLELPDDQLLRVIGRPGFSTAAAVSDLSGRGVGVDVVLTRVRALGGSVSVETEPGQGTAFVLRLPLTTAIIRALLAKAGEERYLLPLAHVAETIRFDRDRLTEVHGRRSFVLREEVLPTVDLRDLVGASGPTVDGVRPGVILQVGARRAALVVDALLGQQEIVVEPFDAPRGTPLLFAGATILPDGAPALVLDVPALV